MAGAASALHLHIGPGCLGLGLVTATSLDAGLDVYLLARSGSKLPYDARFKLLVKGESGETTIPLPVPPLAKADHVEDLADPVRGLVMDSEDLLVTVAATTEGLEARHQFLIDLARRRAALGGGRRTVVIACENDPGPRHPDLVEALEEVGAECLPTMVNRLCHDLEIDPVDGCHRVTVDEIAEWVIEGGPDGHAALAALAEVEHVDFVEDVVPFETRKRWLVNGAHLALAILARARNIASIDIAAAAVGRTRWLEQLHEPLIEALEQRHPGLTDNDLYASRQVSAWLRHEDGVTRILRRLRRAEPLPFFDDLERKLIEPLRSLDHPTNFEPVSYVLDRLHYVLSRAKSYVDYDEFETILPSLPTAVDVQMYARYRSMLVPLVGQAEAQRRADSLGVALESHRRVF
jgi:hypothetical protein